MGQEVVETVRQTAFVKCTGTCEKTKGDFVYTGVEDCEMMALSRAAVQKAVPMAVWDSEAA